MYFSLTERAAVVLADGQERIWRTGAVNRDWDGTWTLVGFSLPESWRRERHDLRSRLVWAGFGPLQSGLWVAPGRVDIAPIAAELGLGDRIRGFHGEAAAPTGAGDLLRTAFDVDAIAEGYRDFLDSWGGGAGAAAAQDDLGRQLLLHTDWLDVVRGDPHLPAEHLPRSGRRAAPKRSSVNSRPASSRRPGGSPRTSWTAGRTRLPPDGGLPRVRAAGPRALCQHR